MADKRLTWSNQKIFAFWILITSLRMSKQLLNKKG